MPQPPPDPSQPPKYEPPDTGDPLAYSQQHAMALAQYYEARLLMRDHAAAYANAAAGAAWAATQLGVMEHHWIYSTNTNTDTNTSNSNTNYITNTYTNTTTTTNTNNNTHKDAERRGRRRQREPKSYHYNYNNNYSSNYNSTSSDDGAAFKSKKRQHLNKRGTTTYTNLLGKTGVSALHEWCDKRRKIPTFHSTEVESDFEFTVTVQDIQWGQGRGTTKGAAKQDAARKALQALLPGIIFDTNGIVVDVPSLPLTTNATTTTTANTTNTISTQQIEELAPSLKTKLSLSRDSASEEDTKRRRKQYEIYSTTTSEDDDDNVYYASRGASVCSALLHAMWQINELIPEPPAFEFQLSPNPVQLKRKATLGAGSTIPVHRTSFQCTAKLILRKDNKDDKEENDNKDDNDTTNTMTAVGTGATKREARHVASAKLLAMLFPDCHGMGQVKAAAEAAREAHAAQKVLKQQSKRRRPTTQLTTNSQFVLPKTCDSPIPKSLATYFCTTLGLSPAIPMKEEDDGLLGVNVEALSISEKPPSKDLSLRPNKRQSQLENVVQSALYNVGDDDVGRTVLRLGEANDLKWIYKLLGNSPVGRRPGVKNVVWGLPGPFSLLQLKPTHLVSYKDDGISKSNIASRLWGPVTIILLLCRAIAPLDEPPLGCSILTVGFSMKKGKTLRVAEIGFEPHLPRERFIECLEMFAANMKCTLEVNDEVKPGRKIVEPSTEICWSCNELREIVQHHITGPTHANNEHDNNSTTNKGDISEEDNVVKLEPGAPLQSVQEETEFEEEKERLESRKQPIKPSKRSRVS